MHMTEEAGPRSQRAHDTAELATAIGHTIRVLRTDQGLSRGDLAKRAGISYSYLSAIENGTKPPSTKIQMVLAKALGVRVHELLEMAESRTGAEAAVAGPRWRAMLAGTAPMERMVASRAASPRETTLYGADSPTPATRRDAAYLRPRAELTQLLAELPIDDVELLLEMARKLADRR
jgi:transcriptional regulator with XRE-family HTH domain